MSGMLRISLSTRPLFSSRFSSLSLSRADAGTVMSAIAQNKPISFPMNSSRTGLRLDCPLDVELRPDPPSACPPGSAATSIPCTECTRPIHRLHSPSISPSHTPTAQAGSEHLHRRRNPAAASNDNKSRHRYLLNRLSSSKSHGTPNLTSPQPHLSLRDLIATVAMPAIDSTMSNITSGA